MKTHKTDIRVRYEETDRMGVAYYGNYFTWFEVARTEFFRTLGLPYTELEKEGLRLMVVDATCSYKLPVTYDDLVSMETEIADVKNSSLSFLYKAWSNGKLVADGKTTHVFTNREGKPVKMPEKAKDLISALV